MKRGPNGAPFYLLVCSDEGVGAPFDKTRERFGRTRTASAGRSPENRPEPIRANPLGRASFKYGPSMRGRCRCESRQYSTSAARRAEERTERDEVARQEEAEWYVAESSKGNVPSFGGPPTASAA